MAKTAVKKSTRKNGAKKQSAPLVLDLTPEGRGNWYPRLGYGA